MSEHDSTYCLIFNIVPIQIHDSRELLTYIFMVCLHRNNNIAISRMVENFLSSSAFELLGRIAFTGDPAALSSHFHSLSFSCPLKTNIADFVMDVMSGFVCMKGEEQLHPVQIILAYLCEW